MTALLLCQISWSQEATVRMAPVQITGAPLVADLEVENTTDAPVDFPDLATRPDLIRFELRYEGKRERRYNTPDPAAAGAVWTLQPGDQRELRLEIPASAGIPAGPIRIHTSLHHTQTPTLLPALSLSRQRASPAAGDLRGASADAGTRHQDVVWVHQDGDEAHLVLHHPTPDHQHLELVLSPIEATAQPWLSRSRIDTLGERSVVWQTGPQRLHVLRLRAQRVRGTPRAYDLPWPTMEIAGSPVTDREGRLHVPVWIPAPAGSGGELRLASFTEAGAPSFQRMSRRAERPTQVLTTIDASGSPMFLVLWQSGVDLYAQRGAAHLPLTGRPLWRPTDDSRALRLALGDLPARASSPGALAVLLATRSEVGIATQWLSVQGAVLDAPQAHIDLGTVIQVLPTPRAEAALIFEDGDETTLLIGDQKTRLTSGGRLVVGQDGALQWRTLTHNGPVNDRPVTHID